jgi:hypothetical protein
VSSDKKSTNSAARKQDEIDAARAVLDEIGAATTKADEDAAWRKLRSIADRQTRSRARSQDGYWARNGAKKAWEPLREAIVNNGSEGDVRARATRLFEVMAEVWPDLEHREIGTEVMVRLRQAAKSEWGALKVAALLGCLVGADGLAAGTPDKARLDRFTERLSRRDRRHKERQAVRDRS